MYDKVLSALLISIIYLLKLMNLKYNNNKRMQSERRDFMASQRESNFVPGNKEERRQILVVDDDKLNLKVAKTILEDIYDVDCVSTGEEALAFLGKCIPDLILLDLYMPGMDGRETINCIMASDEWKNIPIICLTADTNPETETECLMIGASDFITKPFVPQVVISRISRTLELNELRNDLETKLAQKTRLVEKLTLNSIMAIANTIDVKDAYTSGHSFRVAKCSAAIAKRLGWSEAEVQNLHYIALLHDIGKIGIPDAILNKPTQLAEEEFAIIKKHPLVGNEILKDIHMIEHVAEGALYHHEHYDGSGYPFGLKGEDIPICARIVCIADSYDAMTSNRVYRSKLKEDAVIAEFERCKGTQFDPELTDLFINMLQEGFHVPYGKEEDFEDETHDEDYEENKILNKFLEEFALDIKKNAMRDVLTGLYNRTFAENRISRLLKIGHSGVLFDIVFNNLRYINDTYGHIAGDRMLKRAAEVLLKCVERKDIVCRIGGEEFIVFYTDKIDREEAANHAQHILSMLTQALEDMGYHQQASVSIGIAMHPYDGINYETLYNNADKALYYVMKSGKYSYCFYSDKQENSLLSETTMDLNNIRFMIEGKLSGTSGAFHVEYEEFKKIYNYIARCVKRNHQMVQLLLFTLSVNEKSLYAIVPDAAMNALEIAVVASLRMVDVGTRYSSVQYMVILLDSDIVNGKKVAERVIKKFYKSYLVGDIDISYDIQTMQTNSEKE